MLDGGGSISNNKIVKALMDVDCTIVFVLCLRFVHNYLFEIKICFNIICQICSTFNFPLKINQ
jgi:hypothetical protein